MSGYVPIARKMFDGEDPIWEADDPFDRRSAWIDLCQMARHKGKVKMVKGIAVRLERGQLVASERFLATRWRWPRIKVRRFLELLSDPDGLGRITLEAAQDSAHVGTVVTLVNYTLYNEPPRRDRPSIRPRDEPTPAQIQERKELTTYDLTTGAREEMEADSIAYARTVEMGAPRKAFNAEVRSIVSGDDMTAWINYTTGEQVPWEDRARLLRLAFDALAKGAARNLHWAVQGVVAQQYDPLKPASAEEVQARRKPPTGYRGETPSEYRTQSSTDGLEQVMDHRKAKEDERNRALEQWRDRLLARWQAEPEAERNALREQAEKAIGPAGVRMLPATVKARTIEAKALELYGEKIGDSQPSMAA